MNNASSSQPDRHKQRNELRQPEGKIVCVLKLVFKPNWSGCLENIEVLQNVRYSHQPHGTKEPKPNPGPVQVDGDEGGGDGEVVHEGVELQHEPELVRGRDEADEEVDHEEDVEAQVYLLGGVLQPGNTRLHIVAGEMCQLVFQEETEFLCWTRLLPD